MPIITLPREKKPIPPDVHIETVGEFEIYHKGDLYIVEQPPHPIRRQTRTAFRTLEEARIYSKNWQGIPYDPIILQLSPTARAEYRKAKTQ